MSKKMKTTNYFSHDSNARNDEKLVGLRMKHGAAGYGVYFMLLERLREESSYTSVKDYNMLAFDLRVDASLIKSVIEDFGLFAFTDDGKCFYSESFSRRMGVKDEISIKRSEAGKRGNNKRWGIEPAANAASSYEGFLQKFFHPDNDTMLRTLIRYMALPKDDVSALRELAQEVINDWSISQKEHTDYSDFAQHLIATMRIKAKNRNGKAKPDSTAKPSPDALARQRMQQTQEHIKEIDEHRKKAITYEEYIRQKQLKESKS